MPATLLEWSVPAAILLCGVGLCAARLVGFNTLRWGGAVACLGTGYAIMLVQADELSPYKQVVEDAFILGGVILACRALQRRSRRQTPPYIDIAVLLASTAMVIVSVVLFGSAKLETFFVQACCALVLWRSTLPFARQAATTSDKVLTAAFLFIALVLTGQCILYLAAPTPALATGEWRMSVWGTLIQYTGLLGSIVLTFAVFIATSYDAIEKYRHQAHTDALTGLLNRQGLDNFLASVAKRPLPDAATPTALIVADIDNFKRINDVFGHPFGDMVLARFGALLRPVAGIHICAARLGGEEFLLMLPAANLAHAAAIAEEIRANFVAQRWGQHAPNSRFTASMGVTLVQPEEPFASALKRADDLLYTAKQRGRNCTVADEAPAGIAHGPAAFGGKVGSHAHCAET
ncbi:GGDEF domain-containing protein [Achromobacter denitrificans]|uniref:GGDEF domain-containing protein n=1 Tax=Achromobacter denitrificans TaxID=32002 RepID=UPI000F65BCD9|nr:GGDEF domain-containing protein [Achromobacter denitrificans]RSE86976.1 GGDEF domain-containing protein [Achromobacter denitrificans]